MQNTEQFEKMSQSLLQNCSEMNNMMRDMSSATFKSMSIMTQGCNDLCNSMSALMQKSMEQTASMCSSVLSASSMNDLMTTQNSTMKSNIDSLVQEMNNISQLSSKIAQEAALPVTQQLNETMSKISKIKAA